MIRVFVVRLLLIVTGLSVAGCAPAPYRGWSEGSEYFEKKAPSKNQKKSQQSDSRKPGCHAPYRVQSGDTLSEIAVLCGVSLKELASVNQLVSPYTLYVNQQLIIPSLASHIEPSEQVHQVKNLPEPGFSWPVSKKLRYEFVSDLRGLHGLRVHADIGDSVYAMRGGEVVYAGNGIKQYGAMLVIKHDNDYLTVYAHNDTLQVSEGSRVEQKQLIATIGQTGQVTSPQLYVEVRYQGRKVDIKEVLRGL